MLSSVRPRWVAQLGNAFQHAGGIRRLAESPDTSVRAASAPPKPAAITMLRSRCLGCVSRAGRSRPAAIGRLVHTFRYDALAWDEILLELKVAPGGFAQEHLFQTLSYLKFWRKQLGLLVNFGQELVKVQRVPWDEKPLHVQEDYAHIRPQLGPELRATLRVLHEGILYDINEQGLLVAIDAANGQLIYQQKLDLGREQCYPSVTLAGKYLFVSGSDGITVVFEPGRTFKEVARNKLEQFRSTPIFSGTRMYVRTMKNVYCLGK